MSDVDPADAGILYLLRDNARNKTTADIGDALNLAPSTIGTRINELEDRGVIEDTTRESTTTNWGSNISS